jgi:hypothetical protein
LPPGFVVEIPQDGFTKARLKVFCGFPVELTSDFRGVDRIAKIMTGAIGDKGDLLLVGAARWAGAVHRVIDKAFAQTPSWCVRCCRQCCRFRRCTPLLDDFQERLAVVFAVQPFADVFAFAMDRDRFASEELEDHEWNQFFRELVGTIVVAAICQQSCQSIRIVPGMDEVIRPNKALSSLDF